jgi:hypothetical protein
MLLSGGGLEPVDARVHAPAPLMMPLKQAAARSTSAAATGTSTAVKWPNSPFGSRDMGGMIHTNQFGTATIKKLRLPAGGFRAFGIFSDDPGGLDASIIGTTTGKLAFYDRLGKPARVGNDGHLLVSFTDKRTVYLGAQSSNRSTATTYGLRVTAPHQSFMDVVKIDNKTWAGANGSDISDSGDTDFYKVKIPRTGNWVFEAIPDKAKNPLDVTFNVFDVKGRPVAGSFLKPIDAGGPGKTERWTGVGLRAGQTYYLRVDGKGESLGGYGVAVFIADLPNLSIATKTRVIGESNSRGAFVVLSRSDNSRAAMTVNYTLSGTASNGRDYALLKGTAVIPANKLSTTIVIKPILDKLREGDETVIVQIAPSAQYNPDLVYSVKLTIRDVRG